jgi:hypothetical protein
MMRPRVRCVEFVELVTDWSEGALDDDLSVEVEEHLALCPDCVTYLDQLRATSRLVRDAGSRAAPAPARSALLAMYRARRAAPSGE